MRTAARTAALVALAAAVVGAGSCALRSDPAEGAVASPSAEMLGRPGFLVFGGDLFLARKFNEVVHDPAAWGGVFSGELGRLLAGADAVVFNAEGVVSGGGEFSSKHELDPFMYRAHPDAVRILRRFGVDALCVANNHSGDYGKDAFLEMLDRLRAAGIAPFGGGGTLAEAEEPAYIRVGDAVVALVGGDFTRPGGNAATGERPGTLSFDWRRLDDDLPDILDTYARILARARRIAPVVLFSPHWGENWEKAPTEEIRDLARGIIGLGYDGVLGHSAHVAQGVELVDGRPVIYDAGNAVVDYPIDDAAWPSALWRLEINRAGVVSLTGYPLRLKKNRTELAKGELATKVLGYLRESSARLGTAASRSGDALTVACRPGVLFDVKGAPPKKRAGAIRAARSHVIVDAMPAGTTRAEVRFANGVRLLGFRMTPAPLTVPLGAALIELYLTADATPTSSVDVRLRSVERDANGKVVGTIEENHIPGDWLLPMGAWPPGRIVLDDTVFRTKGRDGSTVSFYMTLGRGELLDPSQPSVPKAEGGWIPLGARPVKKGVPAFFDALAKLKEQGRW
jgi:poly-gamma-glutamate capsule biosynthesis protein CapA/YwtB (metallophosphatase superfamily)